MLVACAHPNTERRTDFTVEGIDVSHHQAVIDWEAVAGEDFDFTFLKATEGVEHTDTRFCENWASAKTAGLITGAYHFFRPEISARQQADNFHRLVTLNTGDLPPVLDVETLGAASPAELISGVRTWLYLAEIRYGVKPILYTNLKFYYRYLAGQFEDYPLWIARYGDHEPTLAPDTDLAFWQYGNRGRVAGIEGDVDLNVYFGSEASFNALRLREPAVLTMVEP